MYICKENNMQGRTRKTTQAISISFATMLTAASLIVSGCSMTGSIANNITNSGATSTVVPVTITDAPSDQVIAASLTLNSIVLTNSAGKTTSILSAPLTFEAAHLDAVQEPLFSPSIPEDTYVSVLLTYSNAQVAYIDPATKQVVLAAATLANNSQTVTFATPIAVNNTMTSLLVDFLVANSVAISGSTVTVTPAFHVAAVPIPPQPTNGTNGLDSGVRGKVTALGTNSFTLTNPAGISMKVTVNTNTQYQGLSGFSALAVDALVEVDVRIQSDGSLLALRVEQQVAPNATAQLLVGPVTSVTGSPAASFAMVVRQKIGPAPAATPVEKDTITINGSTTFLMPGRFSSLTGSAPPFAPVFSASTLFAGQAVAVTTNGLTNNAATATAVAMAPQTIAGTITQELAPTCLPCWGSFTLTLPSGSWLATVTGKTTVTVYTNGMLQQIVNNPATVGTEVRFNGFLFMNNGSLVMVAAVAADGPGTPIGPHP
jgi:hypothetical protein